MPNTSSITVAIATRIYRDVYQIIFGRVLKAYAKEIQDDINGFGMTDIDPCPEELRRRMNVYIRKHIEYDTRRKR